MPPNDSDETRAALVRLIIQKAGGSTIPAAQKTDEAKNWPVDQPGQQWPGMGTMAVG